MVQMTEISQLPIDIPIAITRGDDFTCTLNLTVDTPPTPVVWLGTTIEAKVTSPFDTSVDATFVCTPGVDGVLTLYLTDIDTELLPEGEHVWYLRLTKDNYTLTFANGTFTVNEETTVTV